MQRGFAYVVLLIAMAILAIGTTAFVTYWSESVRRQREGELMRIGREFVQAIRSYHEASPGTVKAYPRELRDLLEDPRVVSLRRHLRRVYPDPMTGRDEWGLVPAPGGGFSGVYSLSEASPRKRAQFPDWVLVAGEPEKYSDLKFVYVPDRQR